MKSNQFLASFRQLFEVEAMELMELPELLFKMPPPSAASLRRHSPAPLLLLHALLSPLLL
jgi:hypothetical protein